MKRRILITALVLLVMLSSITTAFAGTARATFTNIKDKAPHLYVSKTVTTASQGYEIPDVTFNFVLKIDGVLASNIEYRVFAKDGTELFDKHDLTGVDIPFTTSRSGDFKLKADQTAVFEYVGAGKSYEIYEDDLEDGFTQVYPTAGLPAIGTILPDGSSETFTNAYTPKEDKKYTDLDVNKYIIFPQEYEAPDAPDFTFTIEIGDGPYANEIYSIIDMKSGMKIGERKTTSTGAFTLTQNQTAKFERIKTDVDYKVTETKTAGWNIVGDISKEGATVAPLTRVDFTNSNVSFGVSKTLSDNTTTDKAFEFVLTDGDRVVMPNVDFYLYNSGGKRADNDSHKTDPNGMFTLKANQVAIFFGLDKGTVYNVSEKADSNYIQVVPTSNAGYQDKEITDNFEILPFINKPQDLTRALTVTKHVDPSDDGEMPFANDDFTFVLSMKDETGEFVPVKKAVYSITIGSGTSTYSTNDNGEFTIKRDQTAVFEWLSIDKTYQVKEINLNPDYICQVDTYSEILENHLEFKFSNQYIKSPIDLKIKKVNSTDSPLKGASFDIYTDSTLVNKLNANPLISNDDGIISIPDMAAGTYYLKETAAPSGYRLLANPIKIEIVRDSSGLKVLVNDEESNELITIEQSSSSTDVILKVTNYRNFELPMAGGMGIILPTVMGLLIIALISLLIFKRRRKAVAN